MYTKGQHKVNPHLDMGLGGVHIIGNSLYLK